MASQLQKIEEEIRESIIMAASSALSVKLAGNGVELTPPKGAGDADVSSPAAFRISSMLKKPPQEIAQAITKSLSGRKSQNFTVLPHNNGFLNFSFSSAAIRKLLAQPLAEDGDFGHNDGGRSRKAIVEFSSPNIGKPMHIGHIRSTILGDSISRILLASGYKTVSSNYLCESGLQTAKLLLAIQLFKTKKITSEKDLLSLYVDIHKEMEVKPELELQAQGLVLKMEGGDKEVLRQLEKVRKLSTEPFNRNYSLLNIKFDEEVYDSDYVGDGKRIAAEALEKGIAFRDKAGEVVAGLEEKWGAPNLIILRSNGTTLYSTRDLGLAERQYSKYKFDTRIYVTASEQNLHFRQVFAILRALGKPYADRLRHIGFGLISLEEGKLSTREGRVLLLEDVINDAVSLALEEVRKRQQYSDGDAAEIAQIVGIAALKYSIIKISSEKDIRFSLREAVKFDGNTAAYLQYTCVRAKNILRKAKEDGLQPAANTGLLLPADYPFDSEEKKLILLLGQFPGVVEHSARNLSPYIIGDYLFKLALQFSSFYDTSPVLKAESQKSRGLRLQIVKATETAIQNGLFLLGIDVPQKM